MTRPLNFAHLPKSIARRPEVRALTLSVYPDGKGGYWVPGGSGNYHVTPAYNTFICTCIAAQARRECAHAIAAQRFHERTNA